MNKRLIIGYVVNNPVCPQDGYWRPDISNDPSDTKFFKKGELFPEFKGKKCNWRLIAHPDTHV